MGNRLVGLLAVLLGVIGIGPGCGNNPDHNTGLCQPETDSAFCARLGKSCGAVTAADNCGSSRTVTTCGQCSGTGETCTEAGACHCDPKADRALCFEAGALCGPLAVADNCGANRTVDCGACAGPGETCTDLNTCSCDSRSDTEICAAAGAVCGALAGYDGCGNPRPVASCGTCAGVNEDCEANHCVCHAETDAQLCFQANARCGGLAVVDRCGATRTVASCGDCTGPETCESNHCVCHPVDDAQLCADAGNLECGALLVDDNCGVQRHAWCGACTGAGQACESNHCTCHPKSDEELCAEAHAACGTINATDNCGLARTAQCGDCTGTGASCTANHTCVCTPQTDSQFCAAHGALCGALTADDNCGVARTVASCGLCNGTGESCTAQNQCRCTPKTDAQLCADVSAVCGALSTTDNCGAPRSVASCGQCVLPRACNASRNVCTMLGVAINDTCGGAEPLVFDADGLAQASGDLSQANDDGGAKNCASSGPDLIYSLVLTEAQALDVTLTPAFIGSQGNSSVLSLRSTCADNTTELRCSQVVTPATNTMSLPRVEAGTYYLWVESNALSQAGTFTLRVQRRSPASAPSNDTCAGAIPLSLSNGYASATGTTDGAHDDSRGAGSCDPNYPMTGPDVVYSFTLASDASVTARVTRGAAAVSSFVPGVYIRTSCAWDTPNDERGCGNGVSTSQPAVATANLEAGTYFLVVDGVVASGPFTLEVVTFPLVTNPTCATAMPLFFDANGVAAVTGDTNFGAANQSAGTGCNSNGKELVYTIDVPQTATVEALVTPLSATELPAVYIRSACSDGTSGSQKNCSTAFAPGKPVRASAARLAPGLYYVIVDAYQNNPGAQGPFNLEVRLQPTAAPLNATCAAPQALAFDWGGRATVYATTENGNVAPAPNLSGTGSCANMAGPELVYSFTLDAVSTVSAKVTRADSDSSFLPSVYIRSTTCDTGTQVACSAIATAFNATPVINGSWAVATNLPIGTHYVFVDSASAKNVGYFTLEVKRSTVRTNDTCATARPLTFDSSGVATVSDDTTFAANDLAVSTAPGCTVPANSGSAGSDLVYSFEIPPGTDPQDITVELMPAAGQATRHTVYLRANCSSATFPTSEFACATATNPGDSLRTVSRLVLPGTYYLVVDGANGMNQGPFTLEVTRTASAPAPANDDCTNPQVLQLTNGHVSVAATTVGARDDYNGESTTSCNSTPASGADLTYQFTLPVDSWVQAQVARNDDDTFFKPRVYIRKTTCTSTLKADQVACGTDSVGVAYFSTPVLLAANTPYYLIVDGGFQSTVTNTSPGGSSGAFTLDLWSRPVNGCTAPTALTFTNGVATVDDDVTLEPTGSLTASCALTMGRELVYAFTTTKDQDVAVKVAPATGISTKFTASLRTNCSAASSEVVCGTTTTAGGLVEVKQRLPANTWYLVVDSDATTVSKGGGFSMSVTLSDLAAPVAQPNETCATHMPLVFDGNGYAAVNGTTLDAADDLAASWCGGSGAGDLVYSFTLAQASSVQVRVTRDQASASFLPIVYLRTDCTSTAFADEAACATNSKTLAKSFVAATAKNLAAGTYYVVVDGAEGSSGNFALEVQRYAPVTNDSCASPNAPRPLVLDGFGYAEAYGDLSIADPTNNADGTCNATSGTPGPDVVYAVTLNQAQTLRAQVTPIGTWPSSAKAAVYVRTACEDKNFEAACKLAASPQLPADTTTGVLPAGTYYVWVDSNVAKVGGPYALRVWASNPTLAAPSNATCAAAADLTFDATDLRATAVVETFGASNAKAGSCDSSTGGDVVYRFTTHAAQKVVITATRDAGANSSYIPVLYLRRTCDDATMASEITCAKGASVVINGTSTVVATATVNNLAAGTWYLVVDGSGGTAGRASLLVQLSAPVTPFFSNDTCATATELVFANGTASTMGSTIDEGNEASSLSSTCTAATTPDVVYWFTTAQDKSLTVTVTPMPSGSQATYHPGIFIRRSCGSVRVSDELACAPSTSAASWIATASVKVLPAGTYYLWVDAVNASYGSGDFTLNATLAAPRYPPTNDTCAGATPLDLSTGSATVQGDTSDALNDTSAACAYANAADVVYSFVISTPQSAHVIVTPTDTTLRPGVILRRDCASTLARDELKCASTGSTPWTVSQSFASLNPGTYYLWVSGTNSFSGYDRGRFSLNVTVGPPIPRPTNDTCADAVALTQGTPLMTELPSTFRLDYNTGTLPSVCSSSGTAPAGADAVFSYTPTTTGSFSVTVTPDNPFDVTVWYNTGTCGGGLSTCLGLAQGASSSAAATLTISGVANTTYFLYVGGRSGNFGTYLINVQ